MNGRHTDDTRPKTLSELPPKGGFLRKYSWSDWTDGEVYVLEAGLHFEGTISRLRGACYRHAEEHELKASVRKLGATTVAVQFVPIGQPGRPPVAP